MERLFPPGSKRHDAFERRGSLVIGDVHPDVADVAGALSPVPGGAGPLTIALLLRNTLRAAEGRLQGSRGGWVNGDRTGGAGGKERPGEAGGKMPPQLRHQPDGPDPPVRPTSRDQPDLPDRSTRPTPMLKVALTGGIATGKSYVLEGFRRRGIPVLDADTLAHGVMAPGTEATAAIAARFGNVHRRGRRGGPAQSSVPSCSPTPAPGATSKRSCTPPCTERLRPALRAFERLGGSPFVVVDVPLLYETGHASDFDRVIVTACPVEVQLRRLAARGLTDAEARQRLAAQQPTDEKAARADFVIRTDGPFEDTDRQVEDVVRA